jgi:hypothetical protein
MDCKIDIYLLYEYIDKTIDPLEKLFLEEHLKRCGSCRKDLTQMKLLLWEMDEIGEAEIPIPSDIHTARQAALAKIFEEAESKPTIKDIVSAPLEGLKFGGEILNFIPAVKSGSLFIKTGTRFSAKLASKASSRLLKGKIKIFKTRAQE